MAKIGNKRVKLVTVAEMVEVEQRANSQGLSYREMIMNAGKGIADVIHTAHSQSVDRNILGLVGKGNNGADTLIALATLQDLGWNTVAYIVGNRAEDDNAVKRYIESAGNIILDDDKNDKSKLKQVINNSGFILDGLLGTGIRLPLRGQISAVLTLVKEILPMMNPAPIVIAVDCPSGLDCDTGEAAIETIRADLTICMAAVKDGLLKLPAFNFIGEFVVVDIGFTDEIAEWKSIDHWVINQAVVADLLPERKVDGHKGTFGTAVVVGGSQIYSGATRLAGEAAYRIGAGLISMCVPEQVYLTQAGRLPEAIWTLLPDVDGYISQAGVKIAREAMRNADAVLIGPGLGLVDGTKKFFEEYFASESANSILPPMVIDADGLKLLSGIDDWWQVIPENTILTPHPGEMAILTGLTIDEIQSDRLEIAERYAQEWGQIVVLKGAFSIVAMPDGGSYILPIAHSVLAHAGTGDVLAGIIVGLLAQGVAASEAAIIGVWVHAQAAITMIDGIGSARSVLARDLLVGIGQVLGELETKKGRQTGSL